MSSIIGRAALRATPRLRADAEGARAIKQGAKRDPELFPLYVVTAAILGWAGYRFVQAPTGSDSSARPGIAQGVKEHTSALNTVIVPNVTLPKELHEKYNKFGKDEYDF
ncbi:uncharacterized protein EI97DRAFT_434136 [Westerdykella ornata]|uniref:Uncharacterized protein n=1 Tax=Westerdykella ornata TaxID=318751 RepID=A0A6A6JHM9_WESOR|nr:uncharacterized protein EI97DRAFT_434136 [Westerdykella ornata]KAF2275725.1 hypothetical protein EI97DRAFT_434136 [Westerdykella ornata]